MNVSSGQTHVGAMVTTMAQSGDAIFDSDKLIGLKRRRDQVLIVSDDLENWQALRAILGGEGWDTIWVSCIAECREALLADDFAMVFCDRHLTDGTYLEVLAMTQSQTRNMRLVVTSRDADWDQYLEALRHGAFELIASPCKASDIAWVLSQAKREDYKRAAFGASKTRSTPI
jgi:DNA-binding NtrC family response regulator